MFKFNWFKPKKIYALPELESIINILFPPIKVVEMPPNSNETKLVYIDTSLDSHVEACLINFQDKTTGEETIQSLKFVLSELRKIRSIVDNITTIPNNSYYVVDTPNPDRDIENININN